MRYLPVWLVALALGVAAAFTPWHAGAQQPLCGNAELTPVACPTATAVPPTPTPAPAATATPFPFFGGTIGFYQTSGCGLPEVAADYYGGNTVQRVIITRNGIVATVRDLFGSVARIYNDPVSQPGTLYRAYTYARETAPVVVPGTSFDPGGTPAGSFFASAAPPCPVQILPTLPIPPQIIVVTATPAPIISAPIVSAPITGIRPPNTGDGGLLP